MSLAINAVTSSGMVLVADSRQSYRNQKGQSRIGSDNASKLFQLNKMVGVAVTGIAFLSEKGELKNVSNFIEEFKRKEEVEKMGVKDLAAALHVFFDEKYDYKTALKSLPIRIREDLKKQNCEIVGEFEENKGILKFKFRDPSGKEHQGVAGVDKIDFLIAGFNHDGSYESYIINIPGDINEKRNSQKKDRKYGASWIGQTDVTSRIILGWESRIFALPFVQEAIKNSSEEKVVEQLRSLTYQISWGTMTIQDAIDFCVLAVKTTEAIQRFSDGIKMDPGAIPGVGGEIDVAIITRDRGFIWVKKKNIKIDDKEIDLDRIKNK